MIRALPHPQLRRLLVLPLMIWGLGVAGFAAAQDVPAAADAARIGREMDSPARRMQSLDAPAATMTARPDTPAGAEDEKFILSDITITGMTAYSAQDIRRLYAPYLGQEISVATLFDIMAAIQNKYFQDGYALTRVTLPPQDIKGGIARIDVAEGYVGAIEIDPSMPNDFITADAARRILAMRPLNMMELERILLIMNALPRMGVGAILARVEQPDPENPNAVKLILRNEAVKETIAGLGFDNHGSVFTGPWQVSGYARGFGIGAAHSTLEVSTLVSTSLPEQKFAAIDYTMPVFGASGANLSFSGSLALTEPGSNLDILDIKGRSEFLSANISYPLIYQRAEVLKLDAGFDLRNADTDYLDELLYDDRLRVARVGAHYSASDSWYGVTLLDVRYARGLDILGARETGSEFLSRKDGHSDFSKMNFLAGRLQSLPRDFELYALINGQYAFDPLLSAEEFGFGGGTIGRGYNPSEIAGDSGIAGTLELRHNTGALPGVDFVRAQPYVFYDAGKVWNIDNNDTTHMSAASAGAGARFSAENGWDMDLNLAFPLTRPAADAPKYSDKYGPRILFELRKTF